MVLAALAALAAAVSTPATDAAGEIEIRFCPQARVFPYPLDSLRGVQGLLLQNVAIINRSGGPLDLELAAIQLRSGSDVVDERRFGVTQMTGAAKAAAGAQAQGMFELAAFQFCDGTLLEGAKVGGGATLAPGEALLLMQNVFAYKGNRSDVAVTVSGRTSTGRRVNAVAALPIAPSTSRTQFRWPLSEKRAWLVGSGASFHSTHRWAVPEEFALDILAIDGSGATHRGTGASNRDFFIYGADVVAAADGLVVQAIRGVGEDPPLLRGPDEGMEAYYGRVGAQQAANLAQGERGVSGNAVVIDHGNDEFSVYAHLAPGSLRVNAGDRVTAGQPIGRVGSSGNSTEPHLHFHVCDKPSSLSCAGIPPSFVDIDVLNADGPRPIQSGDLVRPR